MSPKCVRIYRYSWGGPRPHSTHISCTLFSKPSTTLRTSSKTGATQCLEPSFPYDDEIEESEDPLHDDETSDAYCTAEERLGRFTWFDKPTETFSGNVSAGLDNHASSE